jgi:hypothetical protein
LSNALCRPTSSRATATIDPSAEHKAAAWTAPVAAVERLVRAQRLERAEDGRRVRCWWRRCAGNGRSACSRFSIPHSPQLIPTRDGGRVRARARSDRGDQGDAQDRTPFGLVRFDIDHVRARIDQSLGQAEAMSEIDQIGGCRHHHRIAEPVDFDRRPAPRSRLRG